MDSDLFETNNYFFALAGSFTSVIFTSLIPFLSFFPLVVTFNYSDDPCTNFAHYLKDPSFRYKNFADRLDRNQSLNVNEFSWEESGFSLVDRFYPEMGQLLDEKFKVCESLTYNT